MGLVGDELRNLARAAQERIAAGRRQREEELLEYDRQQKITFRKRLNEWVADTVASRQDSWRCITSRGERGTRLFWEWVPWDLRDTRYVDAFREAFRQHGIKFVGCSPDGMDIEWDF